MLYLFLWRFRNGQLRGTTDSAALLVNARKLLVGSLDWCREVIKWKNWSVKSHERKILCDFAHLFLERKQLLLSFSRNVKTKMRECSYRAKKRFLLFTSFFVLNSPSFFPLPPTSSFVLYRQLVYLREIPPSSCELGPSWQVSYFSVLPQCGFEGSPSVELLPACWTHERSDRMVPRKMSGSFSPFIEEMFLIKQVDLKPGWTQNSHTNNRMQKVIIPPSVN